MCYIKLKQKYTLQLQGQTSSWLLKFTLQPLIAMLMTMWEEGLNQSEYSIHAPPISGDRGPLFTCGVMAVLQGVSLPGGDDGCGEEAVEWLTTQRVRLSDGVMAGRHSLTDQARRAGEGDEEGSLAAFVFQSWDTNSEALEWRPCCFWMIHRLILFNDVFKWDQMCSINLHLKLIVSIRRPSAIAKMASGAGANALTLHGYNERPNKTGL